MSQVPEELRDEIPSFEKSAREERGPIDWSALTSFQGARSALEIAVLLGLFAANFSNCATMFSKARFPIVNLGVGCPFKSFTTKQVSSSSTDQGSGKWRSDIAN